MPPGAQTLQLYDNLSLPARRELSTGAAHPVIASHSICAEPSVLMESQWLQTQSTVSSILPHSEQSKFIGTDAEKQ